MGPEIMHVHINEINIIALDGDLIINATQHTKPYFYVYYITHNGHNSHHTYHNLITDGITSWQTTDEGGWTHHKIEWETAEPLPPELKTLINEYLTRDRSGDIPVY